MNKIFKTLLISSIAVFGVGFLLTPLTFAQAQNLVVEFERRPLFNEANFLPGEGVTRWVKVTNNSGATQRIATEAINKDDPNNLGAVLNLEIKEGEVTRYNNALSQFFNAGEVFLSNLANGNTAQYDFIVTFYSRAGDPFQGKTLRFDLLVGFQGTEGGILPGAGTGAGGFLPPGLTIPDESVRITAVEETNVTITWTTSYFSTSQVIYAKEGETHILNLTDNTGMPPKYGYARTTPEYDTPAYLNGVTSHSVTITGLNPGTKYYYRTVSHASLAISREFSFTTLGVKEEELVPPGKEIVPLEEEIPTAEEEIPAPEEIVRPPKEIEEEVSEEIVEGKIVEEEIEKPVLVEKKSLGEIFATEELLAAIGAMPLNLKIILIIIGIIIIGLGTLWLIRKRKK